MRVLFALPGLHRFPRGAEVALEFLADQIAAQGEHEVILVGSGQPRSDRAYEFVHVPAISREHFERWPKLPFLRHEFMYEELTFAAGLASLAEVREADVTMTCSYPYTNWALRRLRSGKRRPAHFFVTQNGDWPATENRGEPRFFSCDGLICTNPIFYERNRERWRSTLIPNGVDPLRFHPGQPNKAKLGLPLDRPIILMVSALEPTKRVIEAMRAVADVPEAYLVIAGDGPQRAEVDRVAAELLHGRFMRRTFKHEEMPDLYRSAELFLHTKIRESFGNVYIEALSCGTPIVAHDDEVTRWILGEHATLVDTTCNALTTEAIAAALLTPQGGTAGASWAHSRYSWDVVAARYVDFYLDVLNRPELSPLNQPASPSSRRAWP